jgi:L-methionine (R)-S-oxide reductase
MSSMKNSVLDELVSLSARDDASAWHEIAERIRAAGGYRWVGLYAVTGVDIRAVAWTGPVAPAFPRFPREMGLNGVAVRTVAPVVCQDVANDPRYLTAFPTTGSEAVFPVLSESGEVIGTIDVESDRQNAFSADDESFLLECAARVRPLWNASNSDANPLR